MSSAQCQCGSTEIDTDPSRGDSVCMQCGSVLEESGIISEVQFSLDSRGVSRCVGQLVHSEDGMPSGLNLGNRIGIGRESRAVTLQSARKKIQDLSSKLNLNNRCVDTAFGFYKVALTRQLTRGRKSSHVIAACVYMVCRKEETPHMLLDLSDILQVSVYELGKTYLKLSSALCISSPAIDPSLYILRFAHQLQFDKKTHEVAMTASRLVQRMKKDWMHTGRRPSGLCGAALLVAARLHNFSRTVEDVIKVVKVCQATVRKRLIEFSETPSSRLTLDEFMNIDLEEEQDPPAFKNARKKLHELEDENKLTEIKKQVAEIQKVIEKAISTSQPKGRYSKLAKFSGLENQNAMQNQGTSQKNVDLLVARNTVETIKDVVDPDATSDSGETLAPILLQEVDSIGEGVFSPDSGYVSKGPEPTAESVGLKESIEDCMRIPEKSSNVPDEALDLTGLDDEELDNYLMETIEYERKDELWHKHNADYLQEMKEREERKAKEEEENANKPEKKRRRSQKKGKIQASTTGEAIAKMMQQKKLSFKLNYDVLKSLNPENTLIESTPTNIETEPIVEEIVPPPRRNVRAKSKAKPSIPVISNIRKGMCDIMGNTRKKEMLAAIAEENESEEPSTKRIKLSDILNDQKPEAPLETINLDDVNNDEAVEEIVIEDDEEEEYESDDPSARFGYSQEEKIPDYYECEEYVDDYDD